MIKFTEKIAYAVLCKKYFAFSYQELEKMGINTQDEKELIEVLLPYRKHSKNRTMNTNFTNEIFSSKEFCEDYNRFLNEFNTALADDNSKKIQKMIALAEECMLKNVLTRSRNAPDYHGFKLGSRRLKILHPSFLNWVFNESPDKGKKIESSRK